MELERRNAYYCKSCKRVTITVDVDNGVTPFMIRCPHCKDNYAQSFMYQLPGCLHIGVTAEYEWYSPDNNERKKLVDDELEHVNKGGLLMRKRTKAKPIMIDLSKKK